jgi:hypothetical protein
LNFQWLRAQNRLIGETVRRILRRMAVVHPQPSPPWGRGLKFKNPARHFFVRVRLLIRDVETPDAGWKPALHLKSVQHSSEPALPGHFVLWYIYKSFA